MNNKIFIFLASLCILHLSFQSNAIAGEYGEECKLAQQKEIYAFEAYQAQIIHDRNKYYKLPAGKTALEKAIAQGNLQEVKRLVKNGENVNFLDNSNFSKMTGDRRPPLSFAAKYGHNDIVVYLLENGADVNIDNSSPLMFAVGSNQLKTAEILIARGANINPIVSNHHGTTPLLSAIQNGYFDMINLLLSKGANIHAVSFGGDRSPMISASEWQPVEVVSRLIEHGANKDESITGSLPIIAASRKANFAVVRRLTEIGADLNAVDREQRNALFYAAENGHLGTVCYLLEKGVNPNQEDVDKKTPLMAALLEGHERIVMLLQNYGAKADIDTQLFSATLLSNMKEVRRLLSEGANPNIKMQLATHVGVKYQSPLPVAARKGQKEMVELLLKHGADPNVSRDEHTEYTEYAALMYAVDKNDMDLVKILVEAGANVNVKGYGAEVIHYTPLIAAAIKGYYNIAQYLLDHGARANDTWDEDVEGYSGTALIEAVKNARTEMVKLLLSRGADVHYAGDVDGDALFNAVHLGHLEITKLLLAKGADPNRAVCPGDGFCFTALEVAINNGNEKIEKLLRQNGAKLPKKTTKH